MDAALEAATSVAAIRLVSVALSARTFTALRRSYVSCASAAFLVIRAADAAHGELLFAHALSASMQSSLATRLGVLLLGHLTFLWASCGCPIGRSRPALFASAVVRSALGGVLMIDEAYSLLQGEAELGRECVNVLVDMCYAHKDELVVILAGYTDMMADFLGANAGLDSRFPHKFGFSDYSVEELEEIAALMVGKAAFELADDGARQ